MRWAVVGAIACLVALCAFRRLSAPGNEEILSSDGGAPARSLREAAALNQTTELQEQGNFVGGQPSEGCQACCGSHECSKAYQNVQAGMCCSRPGATPMCC